MRVFVEAVEVKGVEFDWTCCDLEGVGGYFSTAGSGVVPNQLLGRLDEFGDVLEGILALPIRCDAVFASAGGMPFFDWIEVAKRGFFAYDWSRSDRAFRLLATPSVPIRVDEIASERLRSVTGLFQVESSFRQASRIQGLDPE